nr:MAG TPA: hypothetical protein [Caudoviricetes sp.]
MIETTDKVGGLYFCFILTIQNVYTICMNTNSINVYVDIICNYLL